MNMNEKYMTIAFEQAKKAYKKDEVPVGCIIVNKNKIIAKAYNKKETKNNSLYHAEILAIQQACKKLKTWRLDDCILYTTMEPCMMCTGAIIQSRIKTVYYSISNNSFGELENYQKKTNKININKGLMQDESFQLIQNFFKQKRK